MEDSPYVVVRRPVERAVASKPYVNLEHLRYLYTVAGLSLGVGYTFDSLFYGRALGVSLSIFVGIFLFALVVAARVRGIALSLRNIWLVAPLLFFAVMGSIRANAQLTWFNVAAVFVLGCLVVYFAAGGRLWELGLLGYPTVVGRVCGAMVAHGVPELASIRHAAPGKRGMKRLVPVLRGLVIALPVLIVFGVLLASADSVFARLLEDTFRLRMFDNPAELMWRIVLVLFVAWLVAGALLFAMTRGETSLDAQPGQTRALGTLGTLRISPFIGAVEASTVLVLVNALFALFAYIQITNVFFTTLSTTDYEAYREYVRRGFGELLVVCVLTVLLIVGVGRFSKLGSVRAGMFYRMLCTLMVALTFLMLASAYLRMEKWQEVLYYISTPVRIYVTVFIFWLAGVVAWLLLTLWVRRARFAIGAFVAALGFLITVNIANPDAQVAAYNLRSQNELSVRFLYVLSDDAVPALVQGLRESNDDGVRAGIRRDLQDRLLRLEWERGRDEWPSLHFSRAEAYELLEELRASGELN